MSKGHEPRTGEFKRGGSVGLDVARRYAHGGAVRRGYADGREVLPDDWRTMAPYEREPAPRTQPRPADPFLDAIAREAMAGAGGGMGQAIQRGRQHPVLPHQPPINPTRSEDWYGFKHGGHVHVGPVVGTTGGRADKLPVDVPSGSFVVPADCVAALGQGNNLAGNKALDRMFGSSVRAHRSDGGASSSVPILISDGEYVISPEQVAKVGRGDMNQGHRTLDQLVLQIRKQHIKTLQSLPGPSK